MFVHARLCEAMSGVAHNCADFGNERKKLGVSAKRNADIDSEVRTLKRGVARCGFDNDITAYADIDIKSLSPGRVLRTPLDPSGQVALLAPRNPNDDEAYTCPDDVHMRRQRAAAWSASG